MPPSGEASLRLASTSPRRRDLLTSIGVAVEVAPADVDETPHAGELPAAYVERLARDKAQAGAVGASLPTLGSDTAVVLDQRVLGKPRDREDAVAMLTALSGTTHEVMTGIAVTGPNGMLSTYVTTQVTLRELLPHEIDAYWRSGEPIDKAGAYAIQGLAAIFVERIVGSHSAVVGLPLFETAKLLTRQGVSLWGERLAVP